MNNLKYAFLVILFLFNITSFSQTKNETVDYINRILPSSQLVNGTVLESKIECDNYSNILFKYKYLFKGDDEYSIGSESFSLTDDSKEIWLHKVYQGNTFQYYQIRFEKTKLSEPIYYISIENKNTADRLLKAFRHLKSISKPDPFRN